MLKKMENLEKSKFESDVETSKTLIKLDNSDLMIRERDTQISSLTNQITSLEQHLRSICGDFLFNCRDLSKEHFLAILNGLENEKDSLLKQILTLNNRVECDRVKLAQVTDQLGKMKIRNSRLEGRLSI